MSFAREFLAESVAIINAIEDESVERLAVELSQLREGGGRLFVAGNGGSAAHASHATSDFRNMCAVEAYCVSDNVPELTARTNDGGWITSYSGYLEASRMNKADGLLIFSVGGGDEAAGLSENIVGAVRFARSKDARVFAVVGRDGGFCRQRSDLTILIPPLFEDRVTAHTEGLTAVIWHLLISHPRLARRRPTWETAKPFGACSPRSR